VDAEAPHLDHRAGIGGELRELVVLGRVAAADLAAVAQRQHAEAADEVAGLRLLDHHVLAMRVELVAVEPGAVAAAGKATLLDECEIAELLAAPHVRLVAGDARPVSAE